MEKDNFKTLKIVLLGNFGIGKTAILVRYVDKKFENIFRSTIGCSFLSKQLEIDNINYNLEIWDTAGQEIYRSILPMYYRNSDIAFVCFDLYANEISHIKIAIDEWIDDLYIYNDNSKRIIYLVGTRADLVDENKRNLIKDYIKNNYGDYLYTETSSKDDLGIDDMFLNSVEEYNNNIDQEKLEKTNNELIEIENTNKTVNFWKKLCSIL